MTQLIPRPAQALAIAAISATAIAAPPAFGEGKPTVNDAPRFVDHAASDWQDCEGLPGCGFVLVRGDPARGPSQWLFRLNAGTAFPKHWHPTPENMVGITGTLTFHFETGETHALTSGDFLNYQAGMTHWGQCEAGEDCLFYAFNDLPYAIHLLE